MKILKNPPTSLLCESTSVLILGYLINTTLFYKIFLLDLIQNSFSTFLSQENINKHITEFNRHLSKENKIPYK